MAGHAGERVVTVAVVFISLCCLTAHAQRIAQAGAPKKGPCTVASSSDFVLGMTQFLGNKNSSDAIWHDELPFFRQHGPLSRITMYRAFFYDGIWHDPGELKGLQFWYGPNYQPPIYEYKDGDANLLGARKPHLPQTFDLGPDELITKVEVQWDPISMRWIAFTTNKGRTFSWGFKDVAGASKAVAEAPVPGSYLAAVRGLEGKPAAVSKKRYIIQLSFVWALPTCKPAGAAGSSVVPLESSRLATGGSSSQRPSSLYLVDKETAELIPQGVEGANFIYSGVSLVPGATLAEVLAAEATAAALAAAGKQEAPAASKDSSSSSSSSKVQAEVGAKAPAGPVLRAVDAGKRRH